MSELTMPPKVAEAISAVMAKVPKLAKGERNSHGNYNFASIDDFLEAVRPLMAEAGLVTTADEDECEIVEKWLKLRFVFYAHCCGESYGPMRRSAMVLSSMGAQALGAAQSYAEKNFLRSLFKIATGEGAAIDADSHPQEQLAQPAKRTKLEGRYTSKTALWQAVRNWDKECRSIKDGDALSAFTNTPESIALWKQLERDAPQLLYGGEGVPPEFEPLQQLVNRLSNQFEGI